MRIPKTVRAMLVLLAVVSLAAAMGPSGAQAKGKKMEVAVMKTSMGEIVFRFYADIAPKACENFERLSKKGYYDDTIFHRVIEDFMIQGGDPAGSGYGGKSIWGVDFEDEFDPSIRFDRKGLLAMANPGRPNTNGSQFFITLVPTPWLDDKHTIFGEVIEGMDVIEAMGELDVNPQSSKPIREVKIESITYEKREISE